MKLPDSVKRIRAIFSDIDGTIVHYESALKKQGYVRDVSLGDVPDGGETVFIHEATGTSIPVRRVPSLTLGGGYISLRTLELVEKLRSEHGVIYCLLTGARTSTYRLRQDTGAVPPCDFGVCEGGGKIWHLDKATKDYILDTQWLQAHEAVCGPPGQEVSVEDPLQRVGPLWDCFRELHALGYTLDAKSFGTAFLVDLRKGRPGFDAAADEEAKIKELFATKYSAAYGLKLVTNLGKGHVQPIGCNKRTAVERILAATGIDAADTMAMFDDENDLEFAALCGCGAVTGIAHPEVLVALNEAAVAAGRDGKGSTWLRHEFDGFLATDAALQAALDTCLASQARQ